MRAGVPGCRVVFGTLRSEVSWGVVETTVISTLSFTACAPSYSYSLNIDQHMILIKTLTNLNSSWPNQINHSISEIGENSIQVFEQPQSRSALGR